MMHELLHVPADLDDLPDALGKKPRNDHAHAFSTWMNASCGMLTDPKDFMRFLPSFCFSSNLRLREMSPP